MAPGRPSSRSPGSSTSSGSVAIGSPSTVSASRSPPGHDGGRLSPAAGRRRAVPGRGARGRRRREDRDRPGQGAVAGLRLPTGATPSFRLRSRWAWTRRRPTRPSRSRSSRPSPSTRTRPRIVTTPWRAYLGSIPGRIGVLGHSYGGKWAMFASCLFEKFACGVWSDPGIVFDESRPNVNYWEPWYLGWEPGRTASRACRPPKIRGPVPTNG